MANPAPTINQINAFNATQGTTIDFNIIGGTELVRSNRIYIYDLSDNSLICTHLYTSTESVHELPPNTDSSIVYESGKSSADFVNGAQYYAQIQTFTDTAGTEGGSGLSVAKMFWCLVDTTLTITTIPSTISTTSYNVSATYNANTSVVSNIIQQYQFSLYSATGSLLQSSGVVVGSGTQQGTSTAYDISYNFTGLSVGSSYYVVVDVTTTQGMNVSAQSGTFTVSIDTPTLGEATVVNNACDGYISVTSNLSGEYGGSASGEIATFETDSVNDVSSLKVTLTPQQDGTPWIGTDHDTTPYLHRAMPTQSNDYNRESGVIVGGTVGWNQLCKDGNFTGNRDTLGGGWSVGGNYGTMSYANNVGTYTVAIVGSASYNNAINNHFNDYHPVQLDHIYFCTADIYPAHNKRYFTFWLNRSTASDGANERGAYVTLQAGEWQTATNIIKSKASRGYFQIAFDCTADEGYSVGDSDMVRNAMLIDLTAMFGPTIADYIYSLEQATAGAGVAWFRKYFPEDYYPYSANTLQSVQATAHKTYDGDGNVIGNYALDSSVTLRGIPKLDASNNLYYDGDTYASDGAVTRKYGIVDLGTLTWIYDGDEIFRAHETRMKFMGNGICTKYKWVQVASWSQVGDGEMSVTNSEQSPILRVHDSTAGTDATAFKSAMSGIYIVYELATPTTETAQAYTNPQIVDPDGTEEYVTANYVPVGHDSTYSLVCPISGYDEVVANVVGKNWLDPTYRTYTLQNNVRYYRDGGGGIKLRAGVTYTLSVDESCTRPNGIYINTYGTSPHTSLAYRYNAYSVSFTPTEDVVIETDCYYLNAPAEGIENIKVQLEIGSIATDYEPYNTDSATYTADLGQTVYGGTVDLVSGEMVIDRAMVDLGTLNWYTIQVAGHERAYSNVISDNKPSASTEVTSAVCSQYAPATNNQVYNHTSDGIFTVDDNGRVQIYDSRYISASGADFKTAMNGAQLCYELATPQTYQLTPQQIQTLVGVNNVWSEQGDIELSYHIPITNLLVKRQDVDDVSGNWLTLYSQPIEQASDMDFTFIDFLNQYGKTYKYALVPLLTQTQSGVEVEVEGGYTVSDEVQSIFDGVFIADQTGLQKCKANVGYGNVDMNQAVGTITPIGAKYPVVITNSKNQYHNGSISGTIVPDDYYFNGNLSRIDMVNKRNELEQFLTNKRAKIIKDWNSNIWLVMIMDNISCNFNNNYGMGMVSFNANWVEVGDPTNQQDLQATGLINVGGV